MLCRCDGSAVRAELSGAGYLKEELPELVAAHFLIDRERQSVSDIPWAGTEPSPLPSAIPTVTAPPAPFLSIDAPSLVPWGIKALGGYLGGGKQAWRKHDAMALIEDGARFSCWWSATPIRSHRAAASRIDASRLRES